MTYPLVIQPEAESDLDEAFRWYESKRPGQVSRYAEEQWMHAIHNDFRSLVTDRRLFRRARVFAF